MYDMLLSSRETYLTTAYEIVEGVHTASLTHLIELLRVFTGEKAVVRLVVTDAEHELIVNCAQRAGLAAARAWVRLKESHITASGDTFVTSIDWNDASGVSFALFLGEERAVETCARAESTGASSTAMGQLLGIPTCCGTSYRRVQDGQSWLDIWTEHIGGNAGVFSPYANHLASYISGCDLAGEYLPCHITCPETARLAREGERAACYFGLSSLAFRSLACCQAPVVILGEDVIFLTQAKMWAGLPTRLVVSPGSLQVYGPNRTRFTAALAEVESVTQDGDDVFFSCGARQWNARGLVQGAMPPLLLRFSKETEI